MSNETNTENFEVETTVRSGDDLVASHSEYAEAAEKSLNLWNLMPEAEKETMIKNTDQTIEHIKANIRSWLPYALEDLAISDDLGFIMVKASFNLCMGQRSLDKDGNEIFMNIKFYTE
jgi:hypothetical protein